ncbi:metabotropic glutamate receptor 4-like [Clytia hemisphaerica]|uniref:metabotropic glutamate receptor 4-like n=1 Tax=Clytia hemisphaerica TaxID=252671 RepID=UPI0034D73392
MDKSDYCMFVVELVAKFHCLNLFDNRHSTYSTPNKMLKDLCYGTSTSIFCIDCLLLVLTAGNKTIDSQYKALTVKKKILMVNLKPTTMKQSNERPSTSLFIIWVITAETHSPGIVCSLKCQGLEFLNHTTHEALPELKEPISGVTFLKHGELTMQLFSWNYCKKMTRYGMTVAFTARYALERLEKDFNRSFGLQIDTNCNQPSRTMSLAFETVSYYQEDSFCKKGYIAHCPERMMRNNTLSKKRIFGVIGARSSFETRSLANILAVHNIPLVSWLASSEKLSQDKDGLRSFFRTIKPDARVETIYKMMKAFQWEYVGFIGSKDSYGQGAFETLRAKFPANDSGCIAYHKFIDDIKGTDVNDIEDIFQSLKKHPKLKIIITFVKTNTRIELMARNTSYIWINSLSSIVPKLHAENMTLHMRNAEGQAVGFTHNKGTSDYTLTEFIFKTIREEYSCNEWIRNYIHRHYNGCNVTDIQGDNIYCESTNQTISLTRLVKEFDSLKFHSNLLIDAVYALGSALHHACGAQSDCQPIDIVQKLHNISYPNANGEMSKFDEKGNPSKFHSDFTLVKYNRETHKLEVQSFGHWNGSNDIEINTKGTVWDERHQEISKQQCSKDCLSGTIRRYLKTRPCCWYCSKCNGIKNYTNTTNQNECNQCPKGYHTEDNINCIQQYTSILMIWLQVHTALKEYAGMMFKGNILSTRIMFISFVMLVQIGSLAYKFGADVKLCNQGLQSQVCIENPSKDNGIYVGVMKSKHGEQDVSQHNTSLLHKNNESRESPLPTNQIRETSMVNTPNDLCQENISSNDESREYVTVPGTYIYEAANHNETLQQQSYCDRSKHPRNLTNLKSISEQVNGLRCSTKMMDSKISYSKDESETTSDLSGSDELFKTIYD